MRYLPAVALTLLTLSCGGDDETAKVNPSPTPLSHTLTGSIGTTAGTARLEELQEGARCEATGGYDDIAQGTQVVVKDDTGKIIGLGRLTYGTMLATGTTFIGLTEVRCSFNFSISDVPEVPIYSLEVADRGTQSYTLQDMKAGRWTVALLLGNIG